MTQRDAGIDFNTIQGEGLQGRGGVTAARRLARGGRVLGLEGEHEGVKVLCYAKAKTRPFSLPHFWLKQHTHLQRSTRQLQRAGIFTSRTQLRKETEHNPRRPPSPKPSVSHKTSKNIPSIPSVPKGAQRDLPSCTSLQYTQNVSESFLSGTKILTSN